MNYHINSSNTIQTDASITSSYSYESTIVNEDTKTITPIKEILAIKTLKSIPKVGLMLVGIGGNNGTTVTGGILANKHNINWNTKEGKQEPNYYGSMTQSSTVRLGLDSKTGNSIYIPFKDILPMVSPNDLTIGGWDISSMNLGDAMKRAQVFDYNLQEKLYPSMSSIIPLPSIYSPSFIAANQSDRVDNVIKGNKKEQLSTIRQHIKDFKSKNQLDKVIILWTANTERFCVIDDKIHMTSQQILKAIDDNEEEISPSTIFAIASILEGCSYINGSPQNTFVPGVVELAIQHNVYIAGDDFKSGQTKMKSVLVDFLISAGIKPVSIVSYNHLGNNDGRNLSSEEQFKSKEISKSNVVDDMVDSNKILYKKDEKPDHCVVIKYVPYVGDSKRALDEYTSEIFMGGKNTIVLHNTCEDSLLATPIIIDLVILCEMCERIQIKRADESDDKYEKFHSALSLLSYLLKAPLVPDGTPVVNALAAQRSSIVNIFRACIGLAPDNCMLLEHKLPSYLSVLGKRALDEK